MYRYNPCPNPDADFSLLWGDTRLADITIHVKVKQPDIPSEPSLASAEEEEQQLLQAKRARTEDGGGKVDDDAAAAAAAAVAVAGDGVAATIQAHAAVLVQRSAFFRAMLMGGGADMVEGRTRTVTVEVEDEDEAVVFERLIRLSYSATYAEDYGCDLDKEELMALLVLGDAYEMRWCVLECAAALPPFESYDAAVAFFRVMPYGYLKDPQLEKALIDGGNVLAKTLGPVQDLWSFDNDEWNCDDDLQNQYRLEIEQPLFS